MEEVNIENCTCSTYFGNIEVIMLNSTYDDIYKLGNNISTKYQKPVCLFRICGKNKVLFNLIGDNHLTVIRDIAKAYNGFRNTENSKIYTFVSDLNLLYTLTSFEKEE